VAGVRLKSCSPKAWKRYLTGSQLQIHFSFERVFEITGETHSSESSSHSWCCTISRPSWFLPRHMWSSLCIDHIHWKRFSARIENWSCFPRFNCSIRHRVAYRSLGQNDQGSPQWVVDVVALFLQSHWFRVHMGNQVSAWKKQSNELPQGFVMSPILFNLYTNDLPTTVSWKFIYADDLCCALQAQSYTELERGLNSDIASLADYCIQWRLTPSSTKTISSVFHLDNRHASEELNIYLNGCRINHDLCPVYLGVSLDRSLTFRQHATKTAAKIKSRNNVITKTGWYILGCQCSNSPVLCSHSVAEYCVPAWGHSSHVKLVDRQLNETMHIIMGTIRPTPTQWLPVLSHIAPPAIKCTEATTKFVRNIQAKPFLLVYSDIFHHPVPHLKSRRTIWSTNTVSSVRNYGEKPGRLTFQ